MRGAISNDRPYRDLIERGSPTNFVSHNPGRITAHPELPQNGCMSGLATTLPEHISTRVQKQPSQRIPSALSTRHSNAALRKMSPLMK